MKHGIRRVLIVAFALVLMAVIGPEIQAKNKSKKHQAKRDQLYEQIDKEVAEIEKAHEAADVQAAISGALALGGISDGSITITISGDIEALEKGLQETLEESDDDSAFTDVADADLTDYVAGTNNGTIGLIDDPTEDDVVLKSTYKGSKRYVRPVVNISGTHTNGIPIGIVAIRSGYKYPPA